jgi:hypothetical protein
MFLLFESSAISGIITELYCKTLLDAELASLYVVDVVIQPSIPCLDESTFVFVVIKLILFF